MSGKRFSDEEVLADHERVREAFALIRRRYPGCRIELVYEDGQAADVPTPAVPRPDEGTPLAVDEAANLTARDRVAFVTKGRWVSIDEIMAITGLTRQQVYAVVSSGKEGGPSFSAKLVDLNGPITGPKLYHLKESKQRKTSRDAKKAERRKESAK
jgi:hypothetical protein